MKRLLSYYLGAIALVLAMPMLYLAVGHRLPLVTPSQGILPDTIKVLDVKSGAVQEMDFEEYIKGVIPAEMPALFHQEALKAQAVAARTYAYHKYVKFTADPGLIPPQHQGAIVCSDSTHCNAYYSKEELEQRHGSSWMKEYYPKFCSAVDDTKGELMMYDHQPILAAFHSSSGGGMTENSQDVWGGDLPYLVSVKSQGENRQQAFVTTVVVTKQEFQDKIKDFDNGAVFGEDCSTWVQNVVPTQGGSVKQLDVGGVTIKGTEMRTLFSLRSAQFDIGFQDDRVVFTVEGSGHGVGMSQYGANYMAENGSDYREILKNYYQGISIEK